jgi:Ni,Fe-hydrogenase maturation factor
MIICVIDGQGGKIGSVIIERLKERLKENVEIIALGTNSIATQTMMKARANKGASGENAIIHTVKKADVIIGTLGILMVNSMLGEFTSRMAASVAESEAMKFILPVTQDQVAIVGLRGLSIPQMIGELIEAVAKEVRGCAR